MASRENEQGLSSALNAICPYFTMFPLSFPLGALPSANKGVVVDPFCGRGTTNLAARIRGFRTVAVDCSPVATAATSAKLTRGKVRAGDVVILAQKLLRSRRTVDVPTGRFWKMAYNQRVLEKICCLREGLKEDRSDAGRILRALMLGALHGPMHKDGTSSYFSNQSPRTYGPKPRYAVKFWARHHMRAPASDVLDIIRFRAEKLLTDDLEPVRARVVRADSRSVQWSNVLGDLGSIGWIITSPPYYGLTTYRADQWLREWFLGGGSSVEYSSGGQLSHRSSKKFASDLGQVLGRLVPYCNKSARLVMRFGSINDRPIDAIKTVKQALHNTGWRIDTIKGAGLASAGKRQLGGFATTERPARAEFDIWCSVSR